MKSKPEELIFQCQFCDMKTASKHRLIRHTQSIHEGLKFQCQLCNLQFTTKDNVARHIKKKHDGSSSMDLEKTLIKKVKHQNSKMYKCKSVTLVNGHKVQCPHCEHKSPQNSDLKRHIQRKHGLPDPLVKI